MMTGTVASAAAAPATAPAWVPDGATTFLDFVNGQYYAGGAVRGVTEVLGGALDEGEISASGMYIDGTNSNRPTPIGAFLSDLLTGLPAGMTLLFDIATGNDPSGFLIFIGDDPDFDVASNGVYVNANGAIIDFNSLFLTSSISGAGDHKIAFTLNRDVGGGNYQYDWSHDGNTAVTDTMSYAAAAMTAAQLGWDGAGNGNTLFQTHIRTITLYPAIAPAELPALTDLPTA